MSSPLASPSRSRWLSLPRNVWIATLTSFLTSDAFLVLRAQAAGLPLRGVLGMMLSFNLVVADIVPPGQRGRA